MLKAGSAATYNTLIGEAGIDTMIGGAGDDTFSANYYGLAAGSVVTGHGTGNVLQVFNGGDISGATITGVQTLTYSGSITLSFAELSEFSSIVGTGTITIADAGTVAAGSTLKVAGVETIPTLAISGGGL